jgi:hypothetical protein
MNKWQYLAAACGSPGIPKTESVLKTQYIAIRENLHRLGYTYPEDNEPSVRFDQLTRACFGMLGKSTKSEILWNQLIERQPTFLDAFVIVSQWTFNVDDARAEKNNVTWMERENRMREREQTRLAEMLTALNEEILLNRTRIDQLNRTVARLTQDRDDIAMQLGKPLLAGDSGAAPKTAADSGQFRGQPGAPAGESSPEKMQKIE